MSSQDRDWMHNRRDAIENVDRQLRNLEGNFLAVLAEHQADTGVDRPPLDSVLPVSFDPSGAGDDRIRVVVEVDRPTFKNLFNSMMHAIDHGCTEGLERMVKLGGTVTDALGRKAFEAGWMDDEDLEED